MSENGLMDRPRRSTRSSLASSTGATPATPPSSSNPYKKPTYFSSTRGGETPSSSKTSNGTPTSSRGRRGRGRGRPPGRNSTTSSRGSQPHTKPECIAVRVDGRRSTGGSTASSAGGGKRGAATGGGRRSTYTSRHDYEYHYGSDFESEEHDSEELEDEEIESEQDDSDADSVSLPERNEDADSDSDLSVDSTRASRLPSPPVPIWLDTEKVPEIPKLEPPTSSEDLLLSRENVVRAVEVYEPLRRFHQLVRLSPFRFEDFCAALASDDQSSLLAEIHIQLLKSIIREEDANGTLFGPNEVKDSVQAVVYFIDHITWPESLRSYLESDPSWADVHDAITSVEYPFCAPDVRIKVLGLLVDQFLTTNVVREQLLGEGNIMHEDHCRSCNRLGELICCETCPAVYHLECITPPLKDFANPPDDWKCHVCMKHQIPGVNDCFSEVEKMGLLIRHERLGYDRHGRKYWFLVRRILVESEDGTEVWYYSTRKQLEDLLSQLDADNYESELVSTIKSIEDEIFRQMEVTEDVTHQQNTHRRKTYLDVESGKESEGAEGPERVTRLKSTGLYKLGQEGLFRTYINLYTTDPAALNKSKQNEERDRKRHMSHKFSLTAPSECKYGIKDIIGCSRSVQVTALKNALTHMETVLPTTLMHVNWPMLRKTWLASVQSGYHPDDFSQAMIMISSCIRNAVYNPVWSESTGHVRFHRMTLMEREEKKKAEKRDKKDKDDEEDRLKLVPQFIKYTIPIRHQVYKQKGEEYRLHGRWGWIWLSNMRRCKSQDCRETGLLAGPHKHVIQVKNEEGKVKTMLIDPSVYNKLMAKRSLAVSSTPNASSNSASTSPPKSPIMSNDCNDNAPEEPSIPGESSSNKDASSKSSDVSQGSNPSKDAEIKEETSEKAGEKMDDTETTPGDIMIVKEENTPDTVEKENNPKVIMETEKEKEVELKVEPMELENDIEIETGQQNEVQASNIDSAKNGNVEEDDHTASKESTDKKAEPATAPTPNKENEINEVEKDQAMEVDKPSSPEPKIQAAEEKEKEQPASVTVEEEKEKSSINGTAEVEPMEESSSDAEKENKIAEDENIVEPPSSLVPEDKEKEILETESTSSQPPPAATNTPVVPAVPERTPSDDSQGRKFRTELVNVSSGLTSTHRILYPKVAKRCEYLDNLLQRKLTLRSLEEKTLKSDYGEEWVLKAKKGIAEFEEEEKKREQEADEYPAEEVLDPHLTLGGAYAFCCYSTECRKAVQLFIKTKGKNRERLYEKICYSPMCRLKFCLQETIRIKQERLREYEKEKYYKVYKEIEAKRVYTAEETSQKVYMKKLPEYVLAVLNGGGAAPSTPSKGDIKKKKTPEIKYPQVSGFQYTISKKPSILVLPPFELRKLSRTAGRMFTPSGFFPNQKSGSGTWGWSLPCGRPVFRTAWQYKTTHARTLGAVALQMRVLYASIKWDDIQAKIPNTEGKHQVHTDTEIVTTEILHHRIVGRFMERVQYLRKMMVVPIDAPKTIREITPSRIGLRKRKRAESPDKMEPVVSQDWVDEERLELWEIRYYGDRIDRRNDKRVDGAFSNATPSASTRTKSGIAIKQPDKYDPSHNPSPPSDKKSYPAHPQQQIQKENQVAVASSAGTSSIVAASGLPSLPNSIEDTVGKTIEQVIRNHNASQVRSEDGTVKPVSAVNAAELMRETIASEMKVQRSAHVSKRDKHNNLNGGNKQATPTVPQPTASQQFQQQLQQNSAKLPGAGNPAQQSRNIAQVVSSTPATSKVGGVVVGKKFFANRQANAMSNVSGLDTGILTKRPMQNTITINKGAGGTISIVKNPLPQNPPQSTTVPQQQQLSGNPTAVNAIMTGGTQSATVAVGAAQPQQTQQRLSVTRLPDGRVQVRGILPGQQVFQTADGKIHLTMSPSHVQQLQQQAQAEAQALQIQTTQAQVTMTPEQTPAIVSEPVPSSTPVAVSNPPTPTTSMAATTSSSHVVSTSVSTPAPTQQPVTPVVSISTGTGVSLQHQQVIVSSHQQPVINISNPAMKSNISASTRTVQSPQITNKAVAQPQQIIVQQQNGQQLIIQGAAAQAILQQQQQQKLFQQRAALQSPGNPIQVKNTAGLKSPIIVASSGVSSMTTPTSQISVPGRLVIQDGKAVLISGQSPMTASGSPQQRILINKPTIQTSTSGSPTVVRPQVIQTNAQGQIVQGQGLQLIQSGQQLHIIQQGTSQQNGQQFVIQQQQQPKSEPAKSISVTSTASGTLVSGSDTVAPSIAPSSPATVVTSPMRGLVSSSPVTVTTSSTATAASTPVKHVLPDGRTILLTQSQLNEFTSGGRKLLVNKQVIQLPSSSAQSPIRPQQPHQVLQTLSPSQPTIQILQGPGGQQYIIQQPAGTQQVLQQGQQQVQIMMPGGQFSGGQPVLLKKYVKPQGSPVAQLNKGGNVVQIPTSAQNQLAQLLGPNKALVRLDNNQLAAIQLPIQQTSSSGTTTMSPSTSVTTSPLVQQMQIVASKSPSVVTTAISQPSTPTSTTLQQSQHQTMITRTPGLPISIVSPSKSKGQLGNQQKSGTIQVISNSAPTVATTPATQGGVATAQVQMSPGKTPTVVRVSGPAIIRGNSTPTTTQVVRSPAPAVLSSARPMPIIPNPLARKVPPSAVRPPVSTPVFATKSAPPQLPPTPPQPQISTSPAVQPAASSYISTPVSTSTGMSSSPVITATKSFPPPLPKEDCLPPAAGSVILTSPTVETVSAVERQTVVEGAPAKSVAGPSIAAGSNSSVVTPVAATAKTKPTNKIVAQIFQTAQGPKVVIQGVSPGDLSQTQMLQLQQQIHKTLAAQQQAQKTPSTPTRASGSNTTLATTPSTATVVMQQQQHTPVPTPTSVATGVALTHPVSKQSPMLPPISSLTSAQQTSPIEMLRSAQTPVTLASSPLASPILARSPLPPTMVSPSPAKILSSPSHMPNMIPSASRSSPVVSRPEPSTPAIASPPVIVARKSAPRKSPIRPNNLDSPPRMMSPPPPPPPVVHNSRGMNSVAAELMQPLNVEQQQILAEHRNALKAEIMEKKKAAATQMRLEAQREIQVALEKSKKPKETASTNAMVPVEPPSRPSATNHHNNAVNETGAVGGGSTTTTSHSGGRGKKRKMKTNSRTSTDGSSSAGATSKTRRVSGSGNNGNTKRKRKVFCICQTPYDKDRFYVGCDKCDNWFHGECVGITEEMSKDLQEYICDDCKDDKLYCICQKPYNDLQFYIQCDKCDDWLHGRCVGVLQGESDSIGDYICPACEPNSEINAPNSKKLDGTDYMAIQRLVKELQSNRSSTPFRKPVTKAQAPNYYSIIKEPMDLQTVTNRVVGRQYERLLDFIADVVKIFENCRYYNDSNTDIFRNADNLEKFFVQKIWALRQSFNARARQGTS